MLKRLISHRVCVCVCTAYGFATVGKEHKREVAVTSHIPVRSGTDSEPASYHSLKDPGSKWHNCVNEHPIEPSWSWPCPPSPFSPKRRADLYLQGTTVSKQLWSRRRWIRKLANKNMILALLFKSKIAGKLTDLLLSICVKVLRNRTNNTAGNKQVESWEMAQWVKAPAMQAWLMNRVMTPEPL